MFSNLIETSPKSSSRRFWSVVTTGISYLAVFLILSVYSVLAFVPVIEQQNTNLPLAQLIAKVVPAPPKKVSSGKVKPVVNKVRTPNTVLPTRTIAIAQIAQSTQVPNKIETVANKVPEVPNGDFRIASKNTEGSGPINPISPEGASRIVSESRDVKVVETEKPPVPPVKKPTIVSKGVINGSATYLDRPSVPAFVRQTIQNGLTISVSVVIDETGKVVSANANGGHPVLANLCEQSARKSKFKPTTLSGEPVKVSGTIVYKFDF